MPDNEIIPIEQILPNRLPLIPLSGRPIFPGIFTPLMITGAEDMRAVDDSLSRDGMIGLVLVKGDSESPKQDEFFGVGTVAKIVKRINLPDGGVNVFISTLKRFKIKKFLAGGDAPHVAAAEYLDDENDGSDEVKALTRALLSEMKQVSENNPLFSEEMRLNMINIDHPGKIADFITSILNIDKLEQQKVLEMTDVKERMQKVLLFIKREQELLRIQKKIQGDINSKIEKNQREYFLREQLKAIQAELGLPSDAKSQDAQKFKERIASFGFEGEVKEQTEQELEKFALMDPNSSEYVVTRNWLDTVCSLPWKAPSPSDFDVGRAREILEEDHYGLEDVKDRILEYLAVRKLKRDTKGSILCLVGPPGVGKTSVGRSVARALGKECVRFRVGGLRDEAEIKGHRRTYVGAMPGKIIQGLKIVKSRGPVFMIDEIDKMGASYQGDPSSALLEVLDPEQNVTFRDHYLDLPFDISDIFFICTANTLDTIPPPLIDRMEIIHLSGYIDRDKLEIAKRYLIPQSLAKSGVGKRQARYDRESLLFIANGYAREAGVRNLEKSLDKIHRKIAKEIVLGGAGGAPPAKKATAAKGAAAKAAKPAAASSAGFAGSDAVFSIGKAEVEKYLGKPVFPEETLKRADRPGVSVGLAWTSMGGDVLLIEATSNPGKEGFKITGRMGEVMQESASIAYTFVRRAAAEKFKIGADWFEARQIHLHIPEGATPKDGPSAGITMAPALISLVTGKRIKDRLAMTGELSLLGKVLPIGGLKEKTIAAHRNGIRDIIIPAQNRKDLEEMPDYVKKGIRFHPVETMEEVMGLAF